MLAEIIRHDFTGICRADGRYEIGIHKTALKEACVLVKLKLVRCKIAVVQLAHIGDCVLVVNALKFQVVNCHHRFNSAVTLVVRIMCAQQHGNHARLPIVAVNHIGPEADNL